MTTWAELLSDIRNDLGDTGTTPRWSDDVLYLYAKDAIRDYSTWFPQRIDRLELSPTGEKYPLPANFLEEIYVECPPETYLEKIQPRPGSRRPKSSQLYGYYVQGGSLYLNSPADDKVYVTYNATHPVPSGKADSTFTITVPDSDMELIRLYVRAKVYAQMRARQASLDRFKQGSGKRDDNPIEPEVEDVMADYEEGIAKRIPGRVILLYRRRR